MKEKEKYTTEVLLFRKPLFLKINRVVDDFNLNFVFKNHRTTIYENDNMRFCFDKKVIRVRLYDSNKDLRRRIQDYFYEKNNGSNESIISLPNLEGI